MSDKERAAQNVTVMGGFVNLLLTGLKGFIGVITNSAGLIADAIHSLTDLATDLFVWLAISFGKKEADENHPHGHKRFENDAIFIVRKGPPPIPYLALFNTHKGFCEMPVFSIIQ